MTEKKLFDNLFKVIKGNSGSLSENDGVFTEIFDLQIPRGYAARIRKIVWEPQILSEQSDQVYFRLLGACVLDPDDETSVAIPTFTVDHDVCADYSFEMVRYDEDTTPNGISVAISRRETIDFDEGLDVVTVRNIRVNTMITGSAAGGSAQCQLRAAVYFTYEKVSADLYSKLLGIS
ncbi:unnamed protein product [marine sediment metagenome]|uniref:Uncharacterized protein n=1 Tax=marine sediment metagenome TaxID=412755 RepID=X1ALI6_9ZZZZ